MVFVLELKLQTTKKDDYELNKRFFYAFQIKNVIVSHCQRMLNKLKYQSWQRQMGKPIWLGKAGFSFGSFLPAKSPIERAVYINSADYLVPKRIIRYRLPRPGTICLIKRGNWIVIAVTYGTCHDLWSCAEESAMSHSGL